MNFWEKILGFDPSRERKFPGQQPGETAELMTIFHSITLIPFFIYMFILLGVLIILNIFIDFKSETALVFNTVSAVILIHLICWRLYNHFLKVIIVTNRRLIYIRHTVLLKREREAIPMSSIQDFRFTQKGVLARIFGYGDLALLGSSTEVKYKFKYVPKVNKVHHLLCEVHQKMSS